MNKEDGYNLGDNFNSSASTLDNDLSIDAIREPTEEEIEAYKELIKKSLVNENNPVPFSSSAVMDLNTGRIKQVQDKNGDWWVLKGDCNRCGECCQDRICPNGTGKWQCNFMRAPIGSQEQGQSALYSEVVDDKLVYGCKLSFSKPWECKIYPHDPLEELYPSCSYKWEKLEE